MKISNDTQNKLKQITKAGSLATKTQIAVKADEKIAKESNDLLAKPSRYMQKFASAIKRLNTF
ncbi:hypothetical protein [Halobacteriovorax sp. HLS]|uniref:hypothetical protein n=1 Tax=Halobacteriovorax sp. HLS TaxID=2234000 RepID=UPI000FD7C343|nr:hypothetical protein [Halobacteriovorax sp. HLS]